MEGFPFVVLLQKIPQFIFSRNIFVIFLRAILWNACDQLLNHFYFAPEHSKNTLLYL